MPWERKVELTETVAGLIKHLRDREFDQIGGLYFESAVKRGPSNLDDTDKSVVLYLENLPTVFRDEDKNGSSTLHHIDLNAANILVDPETYRISGIVDWEMINVAPDWKATEHPKFLQYMEPEDEEEPPIPSYEDESDIAVYIRDRWDYRILRLHFDDVMKRLTGYEEDMHEALKTKAKRDCYYLIPELTGMWNWAEQRLKTYKRTGVSKNGADRSREVAGENESDSESEIET